MQLLKAIFRPFDCLGFYQFPFQLCGYRYSNHFCCFSIKLHLSLGRQGIAASSADRLYTDDFLVCGWTDYTNSYWSNQYSFRQFACRWCSWLVYDFSCIGRNCCRCYSSNCDLYRITPCNDANRITKTLPIKGMIC